MIMKIKKDVWLVISVIIIAIYALFLIYPVGNLLIQSFFDKETGKFTATHFLKFFSQPYYLTTLWNSFKVTIMVTVLSIAIGTPLAYFMTIYRLKGRKSIQILIIIASMSAPFIGAYSWILLMGRSGVVTQFMLRTFGFHVPDIYGFTGILIVMTLQLYPLVFLYVQGALKNVDQSLLEASVSMGCTGFKHFMKIIIPLIKPTVLAAAILVFMRAFADFGTAMLIGEGFRTFPVLLYNAFISEMGQDAGFAAAISVIAILITTGVFLVQKYLASRKQFSMSALNPIESSNVKGVKSWAIHLFVYGFVALSIVPQMYVVVTSFYKTSGLIFVPGWSLDSYREAFSKLGNTLLNTLLIPGISLIIIVLLAVLIAYLVVRRRNALTGSVDVLSMIPYIIPGAVVGIALLTAFNKQPLYLAGTFAIMIIALVIRRLPYTIRSSVATLQQISMSVEEAAISLGASNLKTFFKITVPMMSAGIISGAILSWVTMITELSTAIILYTGKTQTLTIAIYTQVLRGKYGVAAALSTILMVVTVVSLLLFMRVSKSKDVTI